jgi:hypothetical protein
MAQGVGVNQNLSQCTVKQSCNSDKDRVYLWV